MSGQLQIGVASPTIPRDRKSTRLNSSHRTSSYAVFCLKKKNIGIRESSFSVKVLRLFSRIGGRMNERKSKDRGGVRDHEMRHSMFIELVVVQRTLDEGR